MLPNCRFGKRRGGGGLDKADASGTHRQVPVLGLANPREAIVTQSHPVHALRANLESARLKAVETLAAKEGSISPDALRDLATLQLALTAVREEIESHGGKLGWGTTPNLD
jgi:hypothetical protein